MMTTHGALNWVQSLASDEILRIPMGYIFYARGVLYYDRGSTHV